MSKPKRTTTKITIEENVAPGKPFVAPKVISAAQFLTSIGKNPSVVAVLAADAASKGHTLNTISDWKVFFKVT